jgi:hypothetical protein
MTKTILTPTLVATNSARSIIREKAKKQGLLRSAEIRRKVEDAMAIINNEMMTNNGIYPHNSGSISAAEVARRAGIHVTTLFSPNQKELGQRVKNWVHALKDREISTQARFRRTLSERIADWKTIYEGLAQSHRDTELELQAKEFELEQVRNELQKLKLENTNLKHLLESSNVLSIYKKPPAN